MTIYRPLGPATPWLAFLVCLSFAIGLCYAVKAVDSSFYSNNNGFYTGFITVANLYALNYFPEHFMAKTWFKLIICCLTFPYALGKTLLLINYLPFNITPVFLFMQFWVPGYDFLLSNGGFFKAFKGKFGRNAKLFWFIYNEFVAVAVTALIYYADIYGVLDIITAQNFLEGPLIWMILVGNFCRPLLLKIPNDYDRFFIAFLSIWCLGLVSIFTFDHIFRELWARNISDLIDNYVPGLDEAGRDSYEQSLGSLFTRGLFSFGWTAMPYVQLKKRNGGYSDFSNLAITLFCCPLLIILCGQLARVMTIFRSYEQEWGTAYNLKTIDFGFLIGNVGFVWNMMFDFYPFRVRKESNDLKEEIEEVPLEI